MNMFFFIFSESDVGEKGIKNRAKNLCLHVYIMFILFFINSLNIRL